MRRTVGGIVALLLTGIPLSVSAAIGFIALFGQAVLNGVVMVSYFNQLRDDGLAPEAAVLQGAATRLRTRRNRRTCASSRARRRRSPAYRR